MKLIRAALAVAGLCLLSGCLSTKSYLDPKLHDLSWSHVQAPARVHVVTLTTEFYRNGERFSRADKLAQGAIERALLKSGVVALPTTEAGADTLLVKVDNLADMGDAMKKGFGTGLTFGAVGSTVTDGYEITIQYTHAGATLQKVYQHAIHTTVGNAKPVTSATPVRPVQAFDQVIEDAVLRFLPDAQSQGMLVSRSRVLPART